MKSSIFFFSNKEFTKTFEETITKERKGNFLSNVLQLIHEQGINVRYLGLIRSLCKARTPQFLVLLEMIKRVIKNYIRDQLRKRVQVLTVPLEEPYRRLIVDILNLVFGKGEAPNNFWKTLLIPKLLEKFPNALTENERTPEFPLRESIFRFRFYDGTRLISGVSVPLIFDSIETALWSFNLSRFNSSLILINVLLNDNKTSIYFIDLRVICFLFFDISINGIIF